MGTHLAFAAYPIVFALVLVFVRWDLVTAPSFAGLDNVRHLAVDARFWRAALNMVVFLAILLVRPRGLFAGPEPA